MNFRFRHLAYSSSELVMVDTAHNRLFTINHKDGTTSIIDGGGEEVKEISGVTADRSGNIYFVDRQLDQIMFLKKTKKKYSPPQKVLVDLPLKKPSGIFYSDSSQSIYVSNGGNSSVIRFKIIM